MTEIKRTVQLRITGRVQGVCYRAWTADEARERGIAGWVRNRRDGSVEALFHGPAEHVAALIERCREGPPAAQVSSVEILAETGELRPGTFAILPTL